MTDPSRSEEIAPALLDHLRAALGDPDLEFAEPPVRVLGGNRTFVYGFRLSDASKEYSGSLILRVLRPSEADGTAHFEATVQSALVDMGFPAPRILAYSADPETLGGPFQIMERLHGRPMLLDDPPEESSGGDLLKQVLPEFRRLLFGSWPRWLAEVQTRLHRLETEPLLSALEESGIGRERLSLDAEVGRLAAQVQEYSLDGLGAGVDWLRENLAKSPRPPSICHGDFFPNQAFEENGAVTGVIDWSDLFIAPAEVDVGIVKAGIETLPVDMPGPLARVGLGLQRWLAGKYLAAYRGMRPIDERALRYGEALRCVRTLAAVSLRRLAHAGDVDLEPGPNPYDHPLADERLTSRLAELTGVSARAAGRTRRER